MKDNNPADNPAPGASSGASLSPALAVRRDAATQYAGAVAGGIHARIAFACLYPIIDALLRGDAPQLLNWAMAFSVAAIVTLVLRWYGRALNTVVIWRRLPMSCACDLASSYAACRWRSSSAAGRVK